MIIYDIETKTFGQPDSEKDIFKYIGIYDYEKDKYIFLSHEQKDEIKKLFKEHKVIIGFNSKRYDEPILKRFGVWNGYNIHLDIREIIKKRAMLLGCQNESKSLKNLAKFFKLSVGKGELDYDLLKKDTPTEEELKLIKDYTLRDIHVTKEMFDYIYDYFKPFKEYLNEQQNKRFYWLTTTLASYTYKVICNMTDLKEEYSDNYERKHYKGGYVSKPSVEEAHGCILLFDFSSLYPFTIIQNNLVNKRTDKLGVIENILLDFYKKRLEYKKTGDNREYVLKIILNSFYGMLGSPVFKNIHDYDAAEKCTSLGRKAVKHARKVFDDFGFKVLYSDTDSVFIQLNGKTKQQAVDVANIITKQIQSKQLFPSDLFEFKIDDEIKHIYFFNNLKKMYIYVTNDDKLIVKGLAMKKNDSSKLGYIIFNALIDPLMKAGERYTTKEVLLKEVHDLLEKDIKLATRIFNIKSNYKCDTQLQSQILKRYGPGRHELIGNKKIGVGKSTKFCTLKEFNENGLGVEDIDLNKFWKEMALFLETPFIYKRKKQKKIINTLEKWI